MLLKEITTYLNRRFFLAGTVLIIVITAAVSCKKSSDTPAPEPPPPPPPAVEDDTFTNPIWERGADPWVVQKDGTYYFTYTQGSRLVLHVTKKVTDLRNATVVNAWVPPPGTTYSKELWAPELHEINGKWYIYFAADDGQDANHRMYVVENTSSSPLRGNWELKGKVGDPTDYWAIDGTILQQDGQLYMIWSGRTGSGLGFPQNLYIAKMSNPWTIDGERVLLSTPQYSWEKHGAAINEGPAVIKNAKGEVFLTFSGSGYWTDDYCLGLMKLKPGGDPMNRADWIKYPDPVLTRNDAGSVYGPGHNGFFKSPDGREDWIIYHARNLPDGGSTNYRNARIQKITWKEDGAPDFGTASPVNAPVKKPSGE